MKGGRGLLGLWWGGGWPGVRKHTGAHVCVRGGGGPACAEVDLKVI